MEAVIPPVLRRYRTRWLVAVFGLTIWGLPGCRAESPPVSGDCEGDIMRVHFERSGGLTGMRVATSLDTDSLPAEDARTPCCILIHGARSYLAEDVRRFAPPARAMG